MASYETEYAYGIPAISLQVGTKFAELLQLKRELALLDEHWIDVEIECSEGDGETGVGDDGDGW